MRAVTASSARMRKIDSPTGDRVSSSAASCNALVAVAGSVCATIVVGYKIGHLMSVLLMEKLPYVGVGFVDGDFCCGEAQPRKIDARYGLWIFRSVVLRSIRFGDCVRVTGDGPVFVHVPLIVDYELTGFANDALHLI